MFGSLRQIVQAASGSAGGDLLVKLLQRDSQLGIRVELGIPAQRFRQPLVFIVKEWWKRMEQMHCENGPFRIRPVKSEFFDFGDSGHTVNLAWRNVRASA